MWLHLILVICIGSISYGVYGNEDTKPKNCIVITHSFADSCRVVLCLTLICHAMITIAPLYIGGIMPFASGQLSYVWLQPKA
jgi:hypothetical protein